nr:hypothetical protein [Nocardia carnea]
MSENRPGKFTRGYIRAMTGGGDLYGAILDPIALSAALGNLSEIESLCARDAEKLNAAFDADGLPPARVLIIRSAADGLAVARSSPYLTSADLALARAELLAMTEEA